MQKKRLRDKIRSDKIEKICKRKTLWWTSFWWSRRSAVKRAGLDYWHLVDISVYENIDEYFAKNGDENLWLLTTKASVSYVDADLSTPNVTLMFGKETKGLPEWLRERYADHCLRIPMRAEARSLNLSNTAAILCYEALRQQNMLGQIDLNV